MIYNYLKKNTSYVYTIIPSLLIAANLLFKTDGKTYLLVVFLFLNILLFITDGIKYKNIPVPLCYFWIFLYSFIKLIYGLTTDYGDYSFKFSLFCLLCSYLLTYQILKSNDYKNYIGNISLTVLILSLVYITFQEFYNFNLLSIILNSKRIRFGLSCGINPNEIAMYFSLLLFPILRKISIQDFKKRKKYIILFIGIFILFILLTGSKKGFFIALFSLISIPFIFTKAHNRYKTIISLIIVIPLILISIFSTPLLYNVLGNRLVSLGHQLLGLKTNDKQILKQTSTEERMLLIKESLKMFTEKPFFGWGVNAFYGIGGYKLQPHNTYCDLLSSMGLLGLLSFYWFHFYIFMILLKHLNNKNGIYCLCLLLSELFLDISCNQANHSFLAFFIISMINVEILKIEGYTFNSSFSDATRLIATKTITIKLPIKKVHNA